MKEAVQFLDDVCQGALTPAAARWVPHPGHGVEGYSLWARAPIATSCYNILGALNRHPLHQRLDQRATPASPTSNDTIAVTHSAN